MNLLTAVLKDSQIQEFIAENEDSAFDSLKHNFKLEDIYNYIVENINNFITNEYDLTECYDAIKSYSRNYTINVLNENVEYDTAQQIINSANEIFKRTISSGGIGYDTKQQFDTSIRHIVSGNYNTVEIKNKIDHAVKILLSNVDPSKRLSIDGILDDFSKHNFYMNAVDKINDYKKTVATVVSHVPMNRSMIPSGPKTLLGVIAASAIGVGVWTWNKLSLKDINEIPPEVKEASTAARAATEQGNWNAVQEILRNADHSKMSVFEQLKQANPDSIKETIIQPLIKELPVKEATQAQETWNNTMDWAATSKYGAAALALVALGLILKYKFKRS